MVGGRSMVYLFHVDPANIVLLSLCRTNISQILVTCGFEAEVLMGLAAVSRVSPDEVKEEEMMFGSQPIRC